MDDNRIYRYETHMHTFPVSRCAKKNVYDSILYYKELGYTGVFITNHFIDGNINIDTSLPYEEVIDFYFSDYEEGVRIGKELDISVFCGVELSYHGTDFLVYGLDKAWFLAHPEIVGMTKKEELSLFMEEGALVIQAHPYREAAYIDHIRLFPRQVHGVEIYNGGCKELENKMAQIYAESYSLLTVAGSDNHGTNKKILYGIETDTPIENERDYVQRVLNQQTRCFTLNNEY